MSENKNRPRISMSFDPALGKLPPQAVDVEEVVLGQLLLSPRFVIDEAGDLLSRECFYKEANQTVFDAVQNLWNKSEPVDFVTVINELKVMGSLDNIGGPFFITQLTSRVASAVNIRFHVLILKEKSLRRAMIQMCMTVHRDAYDDTIDVFQIMGTLSKELNGISLALARGKLLSGYDIGKNVLTELHQLSTQTGYPGLASGFDEVDKITLGWQDTNLIIIAGRPAMGKTAFAINCAVNTVHFYGKPVGIFSLEMSSSELMKRIISSETEIPGERIKLGKGLTDQEKTRMAEVVNTLGPKLLIDDEGGVDINTLAAKARRMKSQFDVPLIIVDYLQLVHGSASYKGNREAEISEISRSLKALAKELIIPIIALSQLSRETEKRGGNKKPQLQDLRESGAIEQDADVVIFLYRPGYYGMNTDSAGSDVSSAAEVIIAKQRSGGLGTAVLTFYPEITKFTNFQSRKELQPHNEF